MTAKEIIEHVLKESRLTPTDFADVVGLNRGQIYDIQRGATKRISKRVATAINSKFPNYSLVWLMTGEELPSIQQGNTTNVNIDRSQNKSGGDTIIGSPDQARIRELEQQVASLQEQIRMQNQIILNLSAGR